MKVNSKVLGTGTEFPTDCVLISWIARNNDPYERERDHRFVSTPERSRIPGPTMTLLFDDESPYRGHISDAVLYWRKPAPPSHDSVEAEQVLAEETRRAIAEKAGHLKLELRAWTHHDPTDHKALYDFLERQVVAIRKRFLGRTLVIHISPGTPAMQTVWVLMAETGLIAHPFHLVKSYRKEERRDRPPVVPVEIGIPSLLKCLQEARPARVAAAEEEVRWDRQLFQSPRLLEVYDEARRYARLKAPILILGERGTGKTRLASWIRLNSPWRDAEKDKSWPSVPCGQYTPELMRAELFGYKKGAFTGAIGEHEGMLARADGDSLFLDEIGDISRDVQRLLIRAVEEQTYVRLGENRPSRSDFRLITATNLPWERLQEKIDPDFLDRIGYFVLRLPALREIREDLGWLWLEVFEQAATRSQVQGRSAQIGQEHHARVVKALQAHPLPGNLRDLFRVAYHLLAAISPSDESRMHRDDAVDYALRRGLESAPSSSPENTARAVYGAFARQVPLDSVLNSQKPLNYKQIDRALKHYLAAELRRIARERDVELSALCDIALRTLQDWAKED